MRSIGAGNERVTQINGIGDLLALRAELKKLGIENTDLDFLEGSLKRDSSLGSETESWLSGIAPKHSLDEN